MTRALARLLEMLRAGPMERYQIDARFGSRGKAANAIAQAKRVGAIERADGVSHSAWQIAAEKGQATV